MGERLIEHVGISMLWRIKQLSNDKDNMNSFSMYIEGWE